MFNLIWASLRHKALNINLKVEFLSLLGFWTFQKSLLGKFLIENACFPGLFSYFLLRNPLDSSLSSLRVSKVNLERLLLLLFINWILLHGNKVSNFSESPLDFIISQILVHFLHEDRIGEEKGREVLGSEKLGSSELTAEHF